MADPHGGRIGEDGRHVHIGRHGPPYEGVDVPLAFAAGAGLAAGTGTQGGVPDQHLGHVAGHEAAIRLGDRHERRAAVAEVVIRTA